MTRKFTGGHMLVVMLAFFGTVVAVNVAMAMAASRTFGGTVVDNSYVASQHFNQWLEQARAQKALGWDSHVVVDQDRHVVVAVREHGTAFAGATVDALARHPLGRDPDAAFAFRPTGEGTYRSIRPLPAGRWLVHLDIRKNGRRMRLIETLS